MPFSRPARRLAPPIYACGTCARARGVAEADLANWGAEFGNPRIFVSLVEWADRVITESRLALSGNRAIINGGTWTRAGWAAGAAASPPAAVPSLGRMP